MKKRECIKRITSVLLILVMFLGLMVQHQPVFAAAVERVETKITEFTITTSAGEIPPDGFDINKVLHLKISWDASFYQNDLKAGDYFNVKLPKEFIFPDASSECNFDIKTPDGLNTIAKAVVTPDATNGGGTIKVTFTDYVENRYDIKGSMNLNAIFNKKYIKTGQNNVVGVAIGSHIITKDIKVTAPPVNPLDNETVSKWSRNQLVDGYVVWDVRINHRKANLSNAIITDELSSDDGDLTGIQYVTDSFRLYEVVMDEFGNITSYLSNTEIGNNVVFSNNNTKFSYNLGNISGKQYLLVYRTTYKPNVKMRNKVTLTNDQETWIVSSSANFQNVGGQGQGELANKIKLIKVDGENNSILLSGAVFEVTKPDESKFELTTGADGTVTSGFLVQGTYKVKEIVAPKGYELNKNEFTLQVTSTGGAIKKVENKLIKIDISGEKTWQDCDDQDGKRPKVITVNLLADGNEIAEKVVNADSNWKYTFSNLPKFKDGKEIKYSVTEDAVADYSVEINGYDITNKYTPKNTSVTVTKNWNDSNDKDKIRPNSIKVQLYGNGEKKGEEIELKKSNNWTYTWIGLPQKESGEDIKYTVKEVGDISGYTVTVDDKNHGNIIITNTHTPKENEKPKTGDSNNFKLYVMMLFGSLVVLVLLRKNIKDNA